jgi:hypothetical protein
MQWVKTILILKLGFVNRFKGRWMRMQSLDMVVWSGETTFKLIGTVNQHNCVYWSSENLNIHVDIGMNLAGLTAWCDVSSGGIVEWHIVEGTVTGGEYLSMLELFIKPLYLPFISCMAMRKFTTNIMGHPHFHSDVRAYLHDSFPEWLICQRTCVEYSPCLPHLTPCDFYLCSYPKNSVYSMKLASLQELKHETE